MEQWNVRMLEEEKREGHCGGPSASKGLWCLIARSHENMHQATLIKAHREYEIEHNLKSSPFM